MTRSESRRSDLLRQIVRTGRDAYTAGANLYINLPPEPTIVPWQVPSSVKGFVGRAKELHILDELSLEAKGQKNTVIISAIAGIAGVGKTALALHWAGSRRAQFPDGQLYVNLKGHHPDPPLDPSQALTSFLRTLGVADEKIPPTLDERAALFRSLLTGRHMLVLADNAANAEQVRPLLPSSPGCLLLVTSRSRMDGLVVRDGANRIILDVLSTEEAIELLMQRITPTRLSAEPAAVLDLIRCCGHLPLALRIVAERAALCTYTTIGKLVEEILNEEKKLEAFTVEGDESTSIRAVFSWSYRALTSRTAKMFRMLGLHPGYDFTLEAISALADLQFQIAQKSLESLVALSMLEEVVPGRYKLHDLLREYALERVNKDESFISRESAISRLVEWYLNTGDAADRVLEPRRDRIDIRIDTRSLPIFSTYSAAMNFCEAENANFLAITRLAVKHHLYTVACDIPRVLGGFYRLRPYHVWLDMNELALTAARQLNDLTREAHILINLGIGCTTPHEFSKAVSYLMRARALCRNLDNRTDEAKALINLGCVNAQIGQPAEALTFFQQGLDVLRGADSSYTRAIVLLNMGGAYASLGQLSAASASLDDAEAIFQGIGDVHHMAKILINRGMIYESSHQFDKAITCLKEALELEYTDLGDKAEIMYNLGRLYWQAKRIDEAITCFERAINWYKEVGFRSREANMQITLSKLLQQECRIDAAVACLKQAIILYKELNNITGEIQAVSSLALLYKQGDYSGEALKQLAELDIILRYIDEKCQKAPELAWALLKAGTAYEEVLGCLEKASTVFDCSYTLFKNSNDTRGAAAALITLGTCYIDQRKFDMSMVSYREARKLFHDMGMANGEAHALRGIGVSYELQGLTEVAARYLREADALMVQERQQEGKG